MESTPALGDSSGLAGCGATAPALGGRPPGFVLVHGLASNARLWRGVSEALSNGGAGHAVTAIDLRGHGESAVPASGFDTATAASDVAAVIGRLSLERPILAGQPWGGNVPRMARPGS
ncbi:MAG: alpha/beta fold hydrolase [Geodermatophilaceae bacterium]